MKHIHYILFLLMVVFLSSCIPTKKLPKPNEFSQFLKGSMFVGRNARTSEQIKGELLAVSRDSFLVMGFKEINGKKVILAFARKDFPDPRLRLTSITNSQEGIIIWASLLVPLCFTHGWIGIITLPLNLINFIVISVTLPGSYYTLGIPEDISWEESAKYARFPQGWPKELAKKDLL